MAIQFTDAFGPATDTGVAVAPAVRANTQVEQHLAGEIDTGSKLTVAATVASHVPQRPATAPR